MIAFLLLPHSFSQETTAGLQGYVKDQTGAVVPKAVAEVSSPALIGVKQMETDQWGHYRFANLPPGKYTLTVAVGGFRRYKLTGILLEAGRLPTIDVALQVGAIAETVEVSGTAPLVDATQSKVQTNLATDVISAVPKGRSFQTLIQFAPGARQEPLQSTDGGTTRNSTLGYQIDGASNSENSYLIEGMETASIQTGASAANAPFEFIQEVQIKSSGFEAEYGGALGGVVNVIQKRGGNSWQGSLVTYYQGDTFDSGPSRTLRRNPGVAPDFAHRLDGPAEYYQSKKDHYRFVEPGFETGGYLMKDRLWLFGSTVPRFVSIRRTINLTAKSGKPGLRDFIQNDNIYYSLGRVDFLATQKIRAYAAYQYNYRRANGMAFPAADSPYGQYNADATRDPDNFQAGDGLVQPNRVYTLGADITINPSLIATTRWGSFYQDNQHRGRPVGMRFIYQDSNYVQGFQYQPISAIGATSISGEALASKFQNGGGWSNIGVNAQTLYDKYERSTFAQDLAYFTKWFGTHNFKTGYAFNHLTNDVITGSKTTLAFVAYATPYTAMASNWNVCKQVSQDNISRYGTSGVSDADTASGRSCTGLWGTLNFSELGTTGKVGSYNHSIYAQDAWTLGKGVTLNMGVRFDKEELPSYIPGFLGINFGFTQKVAPRLGGAWDLFGTGKLKLYGSYGWFYDIMKFEMPRGSFGGAYWHDCVYALDTPDWTTLQPARGSDGHFCPLSGGANGTLPNLRFIENKDFRTYSNDPNAPGSLGKTGLVDPDLKPMKQHEYVLGLDWALKPTLALETRYSRKRLDRTIEDAGLMTPYGEQ
jgi:hypothetical protein